MSSRIAKLYKQLKNVQTESSNLKLKGTDMNLVVMRPYDLIQMGVLIGSGSEDVLLWIGKTVGRELTEKIRGRDNPKKVRKLLDTVLKTLTTFGFGKCEIVDYKEGKKCAISVQNPITLSITDRSEAEALDNLYLGLFQGMLESQGWEIAMDPETGEDLAIVKQNAMDTVAMGQLESIYYFEFEEEL